MSEVEGEYKRLLREARQRVPVNGTVWMVPENCDGLGSEELAHWAATLDSQVPVRSHKQRALRSAGCYDVHGRQLFVKTWKYSGLKNKLKQGARPGKGLDTWAKGLVLAKMGWSTPRPVGYAEQVDRWGLPICSVFVSEYWEGAVNARHWLRRHYSAFSPDDVAHVGKLLRDLWVSLRNQQVYHADFKLYNLMVKEGADIGDLSFGLIDVDAIRIGRSVTHRELLRNLIQLNGSLGGWVPEGVRLAWLNEFRRVENRVLDSDIEGVKRVTHERLIRELERIDGP